ncbi:hypothetical protein ACFZC5_13970 [Nocardia gamkensis]|uniref:hypothetical protein n=1 Tax=Nocardia gamkensis TaxID=352869 RepID=UPI0036E80E6A
MCGEPAGTDGRIDAVNGRSVIAGLFTSTLSADIGLTKCHGSGTVFGLVVVPAE